MKQIDLTTESYRVYTFSSGDTFRIDDPVSLTVTDSGSHRVVDKAGMTHRPALGWVAVSWMPRPDAPAFVA